MPNDWHFRISALSLFLLMVVIRKRTQRLCGGQTESGTFDNNRFDAALLSAVGILMPLSTVIYAMLPDSIGWADVSLANWIRWTGVGVCVVSLLLLSWSDHHLGQNFSPTLRIRSEHSLVQTGPYRWIRHPIYTSGLLFGIGIFLISANLFVGCCWSGLILLYTLRISREEKMMIAVFGDAYREYMIRTGRFLPKFGGLSKWDRPMR